MILYLKDCKKAPRHHKLLQKSRIKKSIIQKPVAFLYMNNEQTEKKYRKTISFTIFSKK
jgi:hypothetical protein